MTVRIYQDVDGVINAHMPYGWGRLQNGYAKSGLTDYKIRWAPHMIEALDALDAVRVWATTWCADAEWGIAPLVGFKPAERVLMPRSGEVTFPSVYWKIDAIVADQESDPGPFIWLDDESHDPLTDTKGQTLPYNPADIARKLGGLVPLIDTRLGITPQHIADMQEYIKLNSE
jgi:hypothetical protein